MAIKFLGGKDIFENPRKWWNLFFGKRPELPSIEEQRKLFSQPTSTPTPTPTPQPTFGRVTYYLPTGNLTATGTKPKPGYTAAISRELVDKVPMGSIVELPDGTRYRVEDLTAAKIKDTLDIFREKPKEGGGLSLNVPYKIVGRDTEGLKYNY